MSRAMPSVRAWGGLRPHSVGLLVAVILPLAGVGAACREKRPSPASRAARRTETPSERPARDGTASALPRCAGDLRKALRDTLRKAPGRASDAYVPPTPLGRARFKEALAAALGPRSGKAAALAASAGYTVCQTEALVLFMPRPGHALVALRRGVARPILVSVPHPRHEARTSLEGRLGFERWRARALVVAGAHRCASRQASPCPGRTGVCGGEGAFRRSDAGHVEEAQFQAAHEALLAWAPDLTVVSLHGMAEEGISLSDGTRGPVESGSLVARAARALGAAWPGERITSCQESAGVPYSERVCGRVNLQGRLTNGALHPCGTGAPTKRGRFLHIEQSEGVRAHPARVVKALAPLLP